MKHEIEIEGLPGGMIAHSVKVIELDSGDSEQCTYNAQVIAKRVKPRRIVLEETDEENHRYASGTYATYSVSRSMLIGGTKMKWREVKETAPSLHYADDNESLRLSMDDARELLNYIPTGTAFSGKLLEFIKGKQ